jgi:hypothetical protein
MGGSVGGFAKDMGNKNVTDPSQAQWGDLSGGEKGARLTSGVIQGLSSGLQNRQMQGAQMRPGAPTPIQVQPNPVMQNQFDPNDLRAFNGR